MSTTSSFMERFARPEPVPGAGRVSSGSPVRFRLTFEPGANLPEAARLLACRHLPLKTAHAALTTLADIGKAFVTVPVVEDVEALKRELAAVGVDARVHFPAHVDVSAVRRGTHLSVEDFAVRFGLEAADVANWEHGVSEPDLAAKTLLWTIARHPEAVEASIDMDLPEPMIS